MISLRCGLVVIVVALAGVHAAQVTSGLEVHPHGSFMRREAMERKAPRKYYDEEVPTSLAQLGADNDDKDEDDNSDDNKDDGDASDEDKEVDKGEEEDDSSADNKDASSADNKDASSDDNKEASSDDNKEASSDDNKDDSSDDSKDDNSDDNSDDNAGAPAPAAAAQSPAADAAASGGVDAVNSAIAAGAAQAAAAPVVAKAKKAVKAVKGAAVPGGGNKIDFECEDPTAAHTMCTMLTGTNSVVAEKLNKAIQAMNIQDAAQSAVATIDHDADGQMATLRDDLWTLYFCSKQTNPPCDPKVSTDAAIRDARSRARTALSAMQADDSTSKNTAQKAYLDTLKDLGQPAPKDAKA